MSGSAEAPGHGSPGRRVDLAADAFLARRPEATQLCEELGLTAQLVPVAASGASIWARGHLRPMPAGLNLGVPTRWWPLFRSGILTTGESLRAARDLVARHPGTGGPLGDRSVGDIVGERLGRPVVERLVDPLVGGINAGAVDTLSAATGFPLLLAASQEPGSLMRRLRSLPAPGGGTPPGQPFPLFWSLAGSTAHLADALAGALTRRGATIHTNRSVETIRRGDGRSGPERWQLALGTGAGREGPSHRAGDPPDLRADGVLLAVPAAEAAALLAPLAPAASGLLGAMAYASVAVVTLSIPSGAIRGRLQGTGFLVPRTSTIAGRPALITGCTYLGEEMAAPGATWR